MTERAHFRLQPEICAIPGPRLLARWEPELIGSAEGRERNKIRERRIGETLLHPWEPIYASTRRLGAQPRTKNVPSICCARRPLHSFSPLLQGLSFTSADKGPRVLAAGRFFVPSESKLAAGLAALPGLRLVAGVAGSYAVVKVLFVCCPQALVVEARQTQRLA